MSDSAANTGLLLGRAVTGRARSPTVGPSAMSWPRRSRTWMFYRGSACLLYADVVRLPDPWADDRTSRVWIQGDLHAQNFCTYMDGAGMLVFDVNDYDEAYLGHFTWDLQRFAASMALLGWSKALPDEASSSSWSARWHRISTR